MFKRTTYTAALLVMGIILGGILQPFQYLSVAAQPGCQTFKETGKTVCGRFLEYWQKNGGLAQQGLPLSGEFAEVSPLNGKSYTVQYFERAVFEKHPENAAPYDVLLSQLGTFQFKARYPNGDPAGSGQPTQVPVAGESVHFNGESSIKTPPFALSGGTYEVTWSVDLKGESQALFVAYLRGIDNSFQDLLINEIVKEDGSKTGSSFVYKVPKGQFYFDITITRGAYDITLTKK